MDALKSDEIRQAVRQQYGRVAESGGAGCGCGPTCCGTPTASADTLSQGSVTRLMTLVAYLRVRT